MPEQQSPGHYVRRSARLTGTVAGTEIKLDLSAQLAIAYGQKWAEKAQGASCLHVPASGIIRRALQVYMGHLNATSTDPADEARTVLRCCNATPAGEEAKRAAFARLNTVLEGQPLPAFRNVLMDPAVVATVDNLDARVDELVEQINQQRNDKRRRSGRQPDDQLPGG